MHDVVKLLLTNQDQKLCQYLANFVTLHFFSSILQNIQ